MTDRGPVRAAAYAPDGKTLLTGSDDWTVRLWDAVTCRPIGSSLIHREAVVAVAYSPDGKSALTGSRDGTARLWDVATSRPIGVALKHHAPLLRVVYSPDGRTVLTLTEDSTARPWNVARLPNDRVRVGTWVELMTGMALDVQRSIQALDDTAWREQRDRLASQGGPP